MAKLSVDVVPVVVQPMAVQPALDRIHSAPWAMLESAFPAVLTTAESGIPAVTTTPKIFATPANEEPPTAGPRLPRAKGSVGVIPIRGFIGQHKEDWWAGASTESLTSQIGTMMASTAIGAVVLDIDSPGGIIYGTPELAEYIREAREVKPIYSVANSVAASGGYFIGSAATKMFVAPSGKVGSIGVVQMHVDESESLEQAGVKVTLISSSKYKVEGNAYEPLSEEAGEHVQETINKFDDMFVTAVSKGRGATKTVVRETYGQGRMLTAESALSVGMVDGIATLSDVVGAILRPPQNRKRGRALAMAAGVAGLDR